MFQVTGRMCVHLGLSRASALSLFLLRLKLFSLCAVCALCAARCTLSWNLKRERTVY